MTEPDRLQTALDTLRLLGVDPGALLDYARTGRSDVPTVAKYLPAVVGSTGAAAKTYSCYWNRLVTEYGDLPLTAVKQTDIERLALKVKGEARARRNSNGGVGAQENFIRACRRFFSLAVGDGHLLSSPAAKVPMPTRPPNNRRGLSASELTELWEVTINGGDDPILDALLVRLHLETGARRGGALSIRLKDLDDHQQGVHLVEKGGKRRFQPTSRLLLDALRRHALARGAHLDEDQVLRYLPRAGAVTGDPLTRRRYNTLVERWHAALPWAARYGVSGHWLRHTALTAVERVSSHAIARAFAGHGNGDTTGTYVKAMLPDVAAANSALTGELHPLAEPDAEER